MNPEDDGYRHATDNEREQWAKDGMLLGYEILIGSKGVLWIRKES